MSNPRIPTSYIPSLGRNIYFDDDTPPKFIPITDAEVANLILIYCTTDARNQNDDRGNPGDNGNHGDPGDNGNHGDNYDLL